MQDNDTQLCNLSTFTFDGADLRVYHDCHRESTPVACADAVAHPGAEVVKHGHAAVAHRAVLGPQRPHNLQTSNCQNSSLQRM